MKELSAVPWSQFHVWKPLVGGLFHRKVPKNTIYTNSQKRLPETFTNCEKWSFIWQFGWSWNKGQRVERPHVKVFWADSVLSNSYNMYYSQLLTKTWIVSTVLLFQDCFFLITFAKAKKSVTVHDLFKASEWKVHMAQVWDRLCICGGLMEAEADSLSVLHLFSDGGATNRAWPGWVGSLWMLLAVFWRWPTYSVSRSGGRVPAVLWAVFTTLVCYL